MKRKIMLFVDDTLEYHQQLKKGNELQNTYDILFAEDGDKAIEKIKYYKIDVLVLDLFIPMNIFTILLVSVCGIPSVIMLILFSLVCI